MSAPSVEPRVTNGPIDDHFRAGRLADAIAAATEAVKAKPVDADRRGVLVELLCIAGELDRADQQLDALMKTAADRAVGVSLLRQLVRAEVWRQEFHRAGRLPEFVEKPDARMQLRLRASIALRAGDHAAAVPLLAELEAGRKPVAGSCDGKPFDEWRDLDDLVADSLELLTSTGKFFLVPFARVASIELRPPERPRDLLWRRALVDIDDGPSGEVFLPAIYAASYGADDTALRLGRRTDWDEPAKGIVRGRGLRSWLVGDADRTLLEVAKLVPAAAR